MTVTFKTASVIPGTRAPLHAAVVAGLIVLALMVGALVPLYVATAGENLARLIALPALLLLALPLALNRKLLLLAIILFRASGDVFFEFSKMSVGGFQVGVGGLINGFVLLVAALMVLEKPQAVPGKAVMSAWGPFLLTAAAGVVLSPVTGDAIRAYLGVLSYFAVFISAFYVVRSPADFRLCVRIVLWSSAVPVLYALFDVASGWQEGYRLKSTFSHANIFAFYLTLVVSVALYAIKSAAYPLSKAQRLGLAMYMLGLLGLLLLTQTRSAWLACFAIFGFYALLFDRRYLGYLIVAPLLVLAVPSVRERVLDLGSGNAYVMYAKLNSFAWRRLMWESGLQWMRPGHYLQGYGTESFLHLSPTFFPLSGGVNMGAHSVYVQWFFELGALGLTAYLWLLGRILWWVARLRSSDVLAAFVAGALIVEYAIISASDNMMAYLAFNWYFWFIVGAACAAVSAGARAGETSPDTPGIRASRAAPQSAPS